MRTDKEFLEEVYSRGEKAKASKSRQKKAVVLSLMPVVICIAVLTATAITQKTKDAKNDVNGGIIYTGDYREIADNEDSAETDDVNDTICEDYSVPTQTHYPNEEVDGDFSTSSSSGAPLKSQTANDSAASKNKDEAESKESAAEIDGYTLIYGCVATRVTSKESTEKMKNFIEDASKYYLLIDWAKKPEPILTIEIGGKNYSLVEKYICEGMEADGGAYALNRSQLETLRNILKKSGVLSDSIDNSIEEILENMQ